MLAENLRKYRDEKGLKLKEVGEIVGYAENTVSQWERGRCEPNTETLQKLAEIYSVSTSVLLGEEVKRLIADSTFELNGETLSVYGELKKYDAAIPDSDIKEYIQFQKRLITHLEERGYQWEFSRGRELLFIPVELENVSEIDGILLEVPEYEHFEQEEPWLYISVGNQEEGYRVYENIDLSIQRLEDVVKDLKLRPARIL